LVGELHLIMAQSRLGEGLAFDSGTALGGQPGNRSSFRKRRGLILLVLLVLILGCTGDEKRQSEIREKVLAGQHEEAVRLAHEYFADDKRILLVTLEYIAAQKKKALSQAYRSSVLIEELAWFEEGSGAAKIAGRLFNRGSRAVTGLGIRAQCRREGKVVREVRALCVAEIEPGAREDFECVIKGFVDCDDITAELVEVGLRE
jgi:hypothetical protein